MAHRTTHSLRHEYELYVEREVEDYKESVPRSAILAIGDEAVASLRAREQMELDEMVLWDEVDRIIKLRLRIPSYQTWRRRRLKLLSRFRMPEHWGLEPDEPLLRAIRPAQESHVLVAGNVEGTALYLAANGCEVTALEPAAEVVERVLAAAEAAGLTRRVRGCVSDLGHFRPDGPLQAVVCSVSALDGLSLDERTRVIELLKGATTDGGVHLVEPLVVGQSPVSLDELRSRYEGWDVTVEQVRSAAPSFLAKKILA